jgi:hypothetical protein
VHGLDEGAPRVKIGTSLMLVAFGLILAYAVDFELPGIEIRVLGSILFFVGLLGLLVTVGMEVAAQHARHPRGPREPRLRDRDTEARFARTSARPYDPVIPARRPPRRDDEPPTGVLDDETRRLPRR